MSLRTARVVGMVAGGRQHIVAYLAWDDPVLLIPEPGNPYDPNAVAVWVAPAHWVTHPVVSSVTDPEHVGQVHPDDRGSFEQVGYLARDLAGTLALPSAALVGWVCHIRHKPDTTYDRLGRPDPRVVAGIDVAAWLATRQECHA